MPRSIQEEKAWKSSDNSSQKIDYYFPFLFPLFTCDNNVPSFNTIVKKTTSRQYCQTRQDYVSQVGRNSFEKNMIGYFDNRYVLCDDGMLIDVHSREKNNVIEQVLKKKVIKLGETNWTSGTILTTNKEGVAVYYNENQISLFFVATNSNSNKNNKNTTSYRYYHHQDEETKVKTKKKIISSIYDFFLINDFEIIRSEFATEQFLALTTTIGLVILHPNLKTLECEYKIINKKNVGEYFQVVINESYRLYFYNFLFNNDVGTASNNLSAHFLPRDLRRIIFDFCF
jgi:hypothetical protein